MQSLGLSCCLRWADAGLSIIRVMRLRNWTLGCLECLDIVFIDSLGCLEASNSSNLHHKLAVELNLAVESSWA